MGSWLKNISFYSSRSTFSLCFSIFIILQLRLTVIFAKTCLIDIIGYTNLFKIRVDKIIRSPERLLPPIPEKSTLNPMATLLAFFVKDDKLLNQKLFIVQYRALLITP